MPVQAVQSNKGTGDGRSEANWHSAWRLKASTPQHLPSNIHLRTCSSHPRVSLPTPCSSRPAANARPHRRSRQSPRCRHAHAQARRHNSSGTTPSTAALSLPWRVQRPLSLAERARESEKCRPKLPFSAAVPRAFLIGGALHKEWAPFKQVHAPPALLRHCPCALNRALSVGRRSRATLRACLACETARAMPRDKDGNKVCWGG